MTAPLHDDPVPDAALQRMLAHAPDVDQQPSPATRAAIREAAHRAVAPALVAAPRRSWAWLDRWLPRGGAPWQAAFATVVLASFITLMWQGQPVPEAGPDAPMAAAPAPPAPAPAESMAEVAPARPAAPPPAPASAPAPAPARERALPPQPAAPAPQARTPEPAPPPAASQAPEIREAPEARQEALRGELHRAMPAAARPTAAPARAAAVPRLADAPTPGLAWTHVRVATTGGEAQRLDRAQVPQLAQRLAAVMPAAGAGTGDAALPGAVDWRLTLEADGRVLGTLELGGAALRWQAEGAAPVRATPAPAAMQALREALAAAMPAAR